MILLVAFLMACAVLAFPIRVDIKEHGRDNILVRSGQDLIRIPPIAAGFALLASGVEFVTAILRLGIVVGVIAVAITLLWAIFRLFFR